ncbi:MAG: helix-turn-helix transcriptional regulator [Bdellovibrionota bacterium]
MKLKDNLRIQLKQKGMTATALAKKSRVPLQTLNNWLAGSKPRDFEQVKAVADIFGISLDSLVFGAEAKGTIEELIQFGTYDVYLKKAKK